MLDKDIAAVLLPSTIRFILGEIGVNPMYMLLFGLALGLPPIMQAFVFEQARHGVIVISTCLGWMALYMMRQNAHIHAPW